MIGLLYTVVSIFMLLVTFALFLILHKSHKKIYKKGMQAYKQGKYDRALKAFEDALNVSPKNWNAKYMLGSTYFMLKYYEEAKKCFTSLLDENPNDFESLYNYGLVLQAQHQFFDAENYYKTALQLTDNDPDLYFNLGVVTFETENYIQALEYLTKADSLSPKRDDILYYINQCKDLMCSYENENEYDEILKIYKSLTMSNEKLPSLHFVFAQACAKAGKLKGAIIECKKALSVDYLNSKPYKLMGLLQLILKNYEEAKNILLYSIKLNPRDAEPHNLISYAFLNLNNKEKYLEYKNNYEKMINS